MKFSAGVISLLRVLDIGSLAKCFPIALTWRVFLNSDGFMKYLRVEEASYILSYSSTQPQAPLSACLQVTCSRPGSSLALPVVSQGDFVFFPLCMPSVSCPSSLSRCYVFMMQVLITIDPLWETITLSFLQYFLFQPYYFLRHRPCYFSFLYIKICINSVFWNVLPEEI